MHRLLATSALLLVLDLIWFVVLYKNTSPLQAEPPPLLPPTQVTGQPTEQEDSVDSNSRSTTRSSSSPFTLIPVHDATCVVLVPDSVPDSALATYSDMGTIRLPKSTSFVACTSMIGSTEKVTFNQQALLQAIQEVESKPTNTPGSRVIIIHKGLTITEMLNCSRLFHSFECNLYGYI